jgi:hypothetical protein
MGLLPAMVWAQPTAHASGAELVRAIRETGLDPEHCYLVRDLAFARDDIKLFFNHGYLIFLKPIAGQRIAALFTGGQDEDEDEADGELLLLPPRRDERQSLAKFARTPNLDEHFRSALLTFTDATDQELLDAIAAGGRGRRDPEYGAKLARQWDAVVQNLNSSLAQRIVADLLSPAPAGGGFLFASLQSVRLGNFDVIFDPLGDDQILAGQLSLRDGAYAYDVWTSFEARSVRLGGPPLYEPPYRVVRYAITAALDETLHLRATTTATIETGNRPVAVMHFAISHAEQITSARLNGAPVEVLYQESTRSRALRADENDLFLVIAPQLLAPGTTHVLELEHEGDVIVARGSGVYSVAARANWYPRGSLEFARYELEFRYPRDLSLVTPGDIVEDRVAGDFRITRRLVPEPIRVAGFNLGHFSRASKTVNGVTVDVYGNRGLDPALAPRPRATVLPAQVRPLFRGGASAASQPTTIIQIPPPPDPLARLEAVATDVSESLAYFSSLFGPLPLKTLTVSPMPGTLGQGFPGLIYLSTLSYIDEAQRPGGAQDVRQRRFFSDLMAPHEVAHQWWGNVVSTAAYQDEWILEGLAHYSAMLWLEKKRGAAVLQAELNDFRLDLLAPSTDGATVDAYGPLSWGYRLEAARNPDTWRVITYEKGAWVFHMMRKRMGDARFFQMLAALRQRFERKPVRTVDLQLLFREFAGVSQETAEGFFASWVRSTGIPAVRIRYSTSGRAPNVRVQGTISYEDSAQRGVPADFDTELPLEIQFPNGERRIEWVRTGEGTEPFVLTLPRAPARISLASTFTLATER